jgi:predicted dehydrogenase
MAEQSTKETGRRAFLQSAAAGGVGATTSAAQSQAAQKPLRIGVVGVGSRGTHLTNTLVKLASQGEPLEIAAVCDIYQPRLERAEVRFKAKGFKHSADMLKEVPLDAVVLATPDRHHLFNLQEAIRAGKDVYCEKPLSHWAQFDLLKAVVHENRKLKRIVAVGTQGVGDSAWETAAEMIRNGALGKPVQAQCSYFRRGDSGERGMPIDDPNAKPGLGVEWEKFQADAPRRDFDVSRLFRWRLYMDYSGGPVTDVYPHAVAPLYKALRPGLPRKVVAVGGRYFYNHDRSVPDCFDLLVQYPQNLTVVVLGGMVNSTPVEALVRGTEATMIRTPEALVFEPQRDRVRTPEGPFKIVETRPAAKVPLDTPGRAIEGNVALNLKDFLEAVRTRRQPKSDLELGYQVQVPLIMAMRSHLENKAALFDLDREVIRMS